VREDADQRSYLLVWGAYGLFWGNEHRFYFGFGTSPSNTIANLKSELKAITTRSGLVLDGPFVPMPPPFINLKEYERVKETLMDPELDEFTIKVPHTVVQKAKPPSQRNYVMILHDGDERLTLNMRHNTSSYSNQPQKESINMINIYNDLCEDYLEDLFTPNHLSGNPTFFSHPNLTSPKVITPLSGSTTSSSPDHLLEEFADELALITFPPGNDDLPFDIEYDLREIEYLLNHDPTKETDSILKDPVDECNHANPNDNLVDTILEMFTDEHTLDYSSPPLYDDFDDDLFELDFDNEYVYDDPFDCKEDKIKESKLLIDELDPPRSSDFLPSLEYDLFTVQVTSDKNVKKISISHASLILEDFYPPLYELPFHKEVLGFETLLSFSSENQEKVFKPGILTSKRVYTSLLPKLSNRGPKAFKAIKFLKARWRFFLALMERTSVFWMFRVSISIPHEQLNLGVGSS
nr:hypothetical protein [Tanacetum cinerariifolium]